MALRRPHRQVQESQLRDAALFLHQLTDFEFTRPRSLAPSPPELQRTRPYGGWLRPEAEVWSRDPLGLRRTQHDVIPKEILDDADPNNTFRDGSARDAARIGQSVAAALDGLGLLHSKGNLHERFTVTAADGSLPMDVHVCNIVHMSDCVVGSNPVPSPPPTGTKKAETQQQQQLPPQVTHQWMWRHLLHLGPQMNNINTSLKFCYAGSHKATALIFERFHYLETGAKHFGVAKIMFGATLRYFQAAGIKHLRVAQRHCYNLVATSEMPPGLSVYMPLLRYQFQGNVRGHIVMPDKFPGIIIPHPDHVRFPKFKILLFYKGPLVWVGGKSEAAMREATTAVYHILLQNLDTEANRSRYQNLLDTGQILPRLALDPAPGNPTKNKKKKKKGAAGATQKKAPGSRKRKRGK